VREVMTGGDMRLAGQALFGSLNAIKHIVIWQ
jgi:hypothetical protein